MTAPGLEGLAAEADALGGGDAAPGVPAADGGAVVVAPESPNINGIGFLLTGARELLCVILEVETPRRTLDDAKVEACARVLAPVADKYGVSLGGFLDGPEGAAIAVAGPILWGAWRELSRELRERRPVEVEAGGKADDAPKA